MVIDIIINNDKADTSSLNNRCIYNYGNIGAKTMAASGQTTFGTISIPKADANTGSFAGFITIYCELAKTPTNETHIYATATNTSFATGFCINHSNQYNLNARGNMTLPVKIDTTNGDSIVVQGWSLVAIDASFSYRYYLLGYKN